LDTFGAQVSSDHERYPADVKCLGFLYLYVGRYPRNNASRNTLTLLSAFLLTVWPGLAALSTRQASRDSVAPPPSIPEIFSPSAPSDPDSLAGAIAYRLGGKSSFGNTIVAPVAPRPKNEGKIPPGSHSIPTAIRQGQSHPNSPAGAITYRPGGEPPRRNAIITPPPTIEKNTIIDPNPILLAIWQGKPEQAQRHLDAQQAQGHTLLENDRILLSGLFSAMAAQEAGDWKPATARYRKVRSKVRRNIESVPRTAKNHVDLLFWLSFAMLRTTEGDHENAVENLRLSRPERVPDITAFEQDFYRRTAAMVKALVSKASNAKMADNQSAIETNATADRANGATARTSHNAGSLPVIPEMITLPAGRFLMGDRQGGGYKDELPVHEAVISNAVALGRYEVTNREYVTFLNDLNPPGRKVRLWIKTKAEEPSSHIARVANAYRVTIGYARHPVVNVSWLGAIAYAGWITGKTGRRFRLPTEAEWEYATRAGTNSQYWWGNRVGKNHANCDGCDDRWGGKGTAPVGSFPANAFGLHDVHGNVWEWVRDCGDGSYPPAPTDSRAKEGKACKSRIVRGGGWNFKPWYARSAARFRLLPTARQDAVGFRLARDL
ncbi:MAG: Formylglycine-generating enzyme, required for sulfatase activity, contains SUMF1/FGE domain, partial [Candidatus Kentron sp. G]